MAKNIRVYYTNARLNGKVALLAGPFMANQEAEFCIDICGPLFLNEELAAEAATFGVMSCSGHAGFGIYNKALRANGINCPVPDN